MTVNFGHISDTIGAPHTVLCFVHAFAEEELTESGTRGRFL